MKNFLLFCLLFLASRYSFGQDTTHPLPPDSSQKTHMPDTALRIIDLNPYFTLHGDSGFNYQLQINKNPERHFWYLKNAPLGFRINKNTGVISFKADKSYFLSGKLRYDYPYNVMVGVQHMDDPAEKVDTGFTLVFFNTDIIPARVKPTVSGTVWMEEGETASFRVLCEGGSFPVEQILTLSSIPISNFKMVQQCGDEFRWMPGYDLVKESDSAKVKVVALYFIGTTRFGSKDTAMVRIVVRDALNYPLAVKEHQQITKNVERYVLELKYTFLQLDKKLRRTKNTRTTFDLTSASTSLTGTILTTSSSEKTQKTGKILPSVGLSLVPIKEASVPNKAVDQNQATAIRTSIKRLEYMLQDNQLIGEKDPDAARKTNKLREELKQVQIQLIEVPIDITQTLSAEELDRYFNSPKVNKKYRLKSK